MALSSIDESELLERMKKKYIGLTLHEIVARKKAANAMFNSRAYMYIMIQKIIIPNYNIYHIIW